MADGNGSTQNRKLYGMRKAYAVEHMSFLLAIARTDPHEFRFAQDTVRCHLSDK